MATQYIGLRDSQEPASLSPETGSTRADLKRENLDLLEKRRRDVVSSAVDVRRAFFIFGAFSLYLIITVSSTTHLQLLTGTVFKLPILSVDIPILGFYVALPLLYLLAHVNLMGELNALCEDVRRLKQHLADTNLPLHEKIPFGPARALIQPEDNGVPRSLVNGVTLLAIALLPPLVLLLVQIRFLPYHAEWVTFGHRIIILLDVALVFFLWLPLKSRCLDIAQEESVERRSPRAQWVFQVKAWWTSLRRAYRHGAEPWICSLFFIPVLMISTVLITVPDSRWEKLGIKMFDWAGLGTKEIGVIPNDQADGDIPSWTYHGITPAERKMLTLTYDWFEAPTSWHWMRRNLIVTHADLVSMRPSDEALLLVKGDEEETKELWESGSRGLDLRGRNLRYADFSFSELQMVDLRGADLEGAVLRDASLQYAKLRDINEAKLLRCASDDPVHRELKPRLNAVYCRTNLRHAILQNAKMQHAELWEADLTGANIKWAKLSYADLNHAVLSFADMEGADLQGAKINDANLRGVILKKAKLRDAEIKNGTDLTGAKLQGAVIGREHRPNQLTECRQLISPVVPKNEAEKEKLGDAVRIKTANCHERYLQ